MLGQPRLSHTSLPWTGHTHPADSSECLSLCWSDGGSTVFPLKNSGPSRGWGGGERERASTREQLKAGGWGRTVCLRPIQDSLGFFICNKNADYCFSFGLVMRMNSKSDCTVVVGEGKQCPSWLLAWGQCSDLQYFCISSGGPCQTTLPSPLKLRMGVRLALADAA